MSDFQINQFSLFNFIIVGHGPVDKLIHRRYIPVGPECSITLTGQQVLC